jgi:hypothetical protein
VVGHSAGGASRIVGRWAQCLSKRPVTTGSCTGRRRVGADSRPRPRLRLQGWG